MSLEGECVCMRVCVFNHVYNQQRFSNSAFLHLLTVFKQNGLLEFCY